MHVVQADLVRLPFPERHFRRAFSIGVLHHTPGTKTLFLKLLPYLEDGGDISIWVYAPESKVGSNAWRKLTTRLPLSVVYGWCIVNELLFVWPRSLPRGGGRFGTIVPGGIIGAPFWQRMMSDFDDLTPRYAYTHSTVEVVEWFRDAGLIDVKPPPRATSARPCKPFPRDQRNCRTYDCNHAAVRRLSGSRSNAYRREQRRRSIRLGENWPQTGRQVI
jgi:hypothetical protein